MIIFTVPKPFRGEYNIIQHNAIDSWLAIKPKPTILLFGNEEGVADIAKQKKITHIKEITSNRYGTPLINNIFETELNEEDEDVFMYINSDIILANSPLPIINLLSDQFNRFLAIGRRHEKQVKNRMTVEDMKRMGTAPNLKYKSHSWIDYFIYTRGVFESIPPFALGRTFWDKWLVWNALQRNVPVVDITKQFNAVHQSHSYSVSSKTNIQTVWAGNEAMENLRLAGGWSNSSTIADANFRLEKDILHPQKRQNSIIRHILDLFPILWPFFLQVRLWREKRSLVMNKK